MSCTCVRCRRVRCCVRCVRRRAATSAAWRLCWRASSLRSVVRCDCCSRSVGMWRSASCALTRRCRRCCCRCRSLSCTAGPPARQRRTAAPMAHRRRACVARRFRWLSTVWLLLVLLRSCLTVGSCGALWAARRVCFAFWASSNQVGAHSSASTCSRGCRISARRSVTARCSTCCTVCTRCVARTMASWRRCAVWRSCRCVVARCAARRRCSIRRCRRRRSFWTARRRSRVVASRTLRCLACWSVSGCAAA